MQSWKNTLTTAICGLLTVFVPLMFGLRILELPNLEQKLLAGVFLVPLVGLYFRWLNSSGHHLWLPINLAVGTLTAASAYSWAKKNPDALAQITLYFE